MTKSLFGSRYAGHRNYGEKLMRYVFSAVMLESEQAWRIAIECFLTLTEILAASVSMPFSFRVKTLGFELDNPGIWDCVLPYFQLEFCRKIGK